MKKAFTMIEIVMVMLIVALSAAVIAPKVINMKKDWDLEGEVRKFSAELRYLQQKSRVENKNQAISFTPGNNYYEEGTYKTSFMPGTEGPINLKTGISFMSANCSVTPKLDPFVLYFDRLGAPYVMDDMWMDQAAGCDINLVDSSGKNLAIEIMNMTGKIRIKR